MDLTIGDPSKKPGSKDLKSLKSMDGKAAEPYFQRLFSRPTNKSGPQATGADDEFAFPLIDDFDDDDFQINVIDKNGKKPASEHGSVMDLSDYSDMPSPDDFFRMKLGPVNEAKQKAGVPDKTLPDTASEESGGITDEAMSILEGELTDYEQYINIEAGNPTARRRSIGPSPTSESENENEYSPKLKSANTGAARDKAALPPADKENCDPETRLSSESLFYHGGSSTLPSSTMKRPHCEESSVVEESHETPNKRPRLTPLETISPSSLNIDADRLSGELEVHPSRIPASKVEGNGKEPDDPQGDAWEGIDLSLLEEYKEFVNFL